MIINRNNYSVFFLDYYDNSLDKLQTEELFIFLKNNPDLNDEFLNFEIININVIDDIIFPDKSKLKLTNTENNSFINEKNYTKYFYAFIENQLNDVQLVELNFFLDNNPYAANEFKIFKLTKLNPDFCLVFNHKENIKRPVINYFKIVSYSIAATLALLLSLSFTFNYLHSYNFRTLFSDYHVHNNRFVINMSNLSVPVKFYKTKSRNFRHSISIDKIRTLTSEIPTYNFLITELKPLISSTISVKPLIQNTRDDFYKSLTLTTINSRKNTKVKLNLLNFSYYFSKIVNFVFDKNIEYEQYLDDHGNVIALNIKSDNFEYERKIK